MTRDQGLDVADSADSRERDAGGDVDEESRDRSQALWPVSGPLRHRHGDGARVGPRRKPDRDASRVRAGRERKPYDAEDDGENCASHPVT